MVNPNIVDAATNYSSSVADYASANAVASMGEALILALLGVWLVVMVIALIIAVLSIIAHWKVFKKAGEKGWKAIIPIYGTITLFKVAGVSPWLVLGYLAGFIPWIGGLICAGITIYVMISLAKAFDKGTGFTVGLILLNTIFMLILAFGDAEYQLKEEKADDPIDITEE